MSMRVTCRNVRVRRSKRDHYALGLNTASCIGRCVPVLGVRSPILDVVSKMIDPEPCRLCEVSKEKKENAKLLTSLAHRHNLDITVMPYEADVTN